MAIYLIDLFFKLKENCRLKIDKDQKGVSPWYGVNKKESQFDIFHYNTFLMGLYKYLEKVFLWKCAIKVDNILNCHNVVKLVHISTIR
jgi:hypothetical protein